jgi:hypothetical protein
LSKKGLPSGRLIESGEIDWATRRVMGIDEALARDDAIQLPAGVRASKSSLTATELKAAHRDERFVGGTYRVEAVDALLAKLGLKFDPTNTKPLLSDYRVAPLDEGKFIVPKGHILFGPATEKLGQLGLKKTAFDKSECAALVQCLGVANTDQWRRGPWVQGTDFLAPGTVIATLRSGVYLSDYSGRSHVGIFLGKDHHGLWMLDQFRGGTGTVGIRRKTFGAPHHEVRVKASTYLFDGYSYRREIVDKDGKKIYGHDYSLDTIRTKSELTGDGSEYYILLDDGEVARKDSPVADRPRSPEENREAVKELVTELFGMTSEEFAEKVRRDAQELRNAADSVRPAR